MSRVIYLDIVNPITGLRQHWIVSADNKGRAFESAERIYKELKRYHRFKQAVRNFKIFGDEEELYTEFTKMSKEEVNNAD